MVANALVAVAYVALYLGAALWGRDVATIGYGEVGGIAPWFPAAGFAVALLVGFGIRWAPLVFVTELISGVVIFNIDDTFTAAQIVLNAASIAAVWTVTAYVLRRVVRIDTSLQDMRSLVWLLIVGVGVAPLVSALVGVGMRAWAGADPGSEYFNNVRTWWVGDAIGIASVTPAVLTVGSAWVNRVRPSLGRTANRLEDVLQAIAVIAAPFVLYALQGPNNRLLLLTVFPVIWVAVTRGFLLTTVAVLYTNAAATFAADREGLGGLGLTDIQTFMLTLAVIALGVAAATRELRRGRAELAYQAAHDFLTGLPNRRTFFTRLSSAVEEGGEVSVVFFNVDRLKIVGDSLGLEIMDRLLKQVGERVADAVGHECLVCRYGGDEFAVLIHGPGAEQRGQSAAARIVAVLELPFTENGHELFAPASVGVATAHEPGQDAGTLMRRADVARTEARRRGGDNWVVYSDELRAEILDRNELARQLRAARDRDELSVEFQPIFALPEREVAYVESLVRWRSAERGPVSPAVFIPVAEDTGAIGDIWRFVLEIACQRAARWPATSPSGPPVVTVNISVCQLGHDRVLTDIDRALTRSGLDPGRLAIEITESMALEDPEATIAFLHRMRRLGIQLWIDDFGSGYSSLGYLHLLPVSVVKVDRMFVEHLEPGSRGDTVVNAVVALGRGLDMRVVMEGVENDEQLAHLDRLGCDAVQGFRLSRPLPVDRLDELLHTADEDARAIRSPASPA